MYEQINAMLYVIYNSTKQSFNIALVEIYKVALLANFVVRLSYRSSY